MPDAVIIRLDRSRPFSECRGERAPDDPHYRVHYWQGQLVGKNMILLPFDAAGELVPEDLTKTQPYPGIVDGKPVMHQPLYTQAMRDLLDRKKRRQQTIEAPGGTDGGDTDVDRPPAGMPSILEEVNFVSWLRGEARYEWSLLQIAAKARYSRVFTSKRELVTDLVLDEKVVPESQVCPELAKLLPESAAA